MLSNLFFIANIDDHKYNIFLLFIIVIRYVTLFRYRGTQFSITIWYAIQYQHLIHKSVLWLDAQLNITVLYATQRRY